MKTPQERIEEVKKKIIEESHQMTAFTYQIEEADLDEAFETLSNTIHEELAKEVQGMEGKELPVYIRICGHEKGMGYNQSISDIATLCRSKIIK